MSEYCENKRCGHLLKTGYAAKMVPWGLFTLTYTGSETECPYCQWGKTADDQMDDINKKLDK